MAGSALSVPSDLAPDGRGHRFWQEIAAEFDMAATERELLAEACRALDELDALRAAVAQDGATVTGSRGQTRVHPALGELRQGRAELRRLIEALNLPAEDQGDGGVLSLTARRAQYAARQRWQGRGARDAS